MIRSTLFSSNVSSHGSNTIDVSVSIVTFKTDPAELSRSLEGFVGSRLQLQITIVDNSPTDALREVAQRFAVSYLKNRQNIGFGAGHNLVLGEQIKRAKYHLVINADVVLSPHVIESLFSFMETHPEVGQVMPRILNPNGTEQKLCKLLPTPVDLLQRRFLGKFAHLFTARQRVSYELEEIDLSVPTRVPNLSGCFMFLRGSILQQTGLFDERYFLYMEDVDLCRRIGALSSTVFFPEVSVVHRYEKGSYRKKNLLLLHLISALKYFNKWGWWNDAERQALNGKITHLTS